ncbi:MAG: CHAT domain-containing protein, partial [Bdellovibrionales bacterium]|nr:CHAT domain-containing protein [Bdellovibrionales bacterium]
VLAHATDRAPRGTDFGPLPGTAAEASEVGEQLGAFALVGPDATEARLRREARGQLILHLATHGYVREDLMRGLHGKADEKLSAFGLDRHLAAGHDPMLLSGLAMAGANTGDGGYGDDGILTALEASMLDLEACDLVVLSACETARGTAESHDMIPMTMDGGFSLSPKISQRSTMTVGLEYRDATDTSKTPTLRKVNFGVEINSNKFFQARFGASRGYWTAGLGFTGKSGSLEFGSWADEASKTGFRQVEDRRFTMGYGGRF